MKVVRGHNSSLREQSVSASGTGPTRLLGAASPITTNPRIPRAHNWGQRLILYDQHTSRAARRGAWSAKTHCQPVVPSSLRRRSERQAGQERAIVTCRLSSDRRGAATSRSTHHGSPPVSHPRRVDCRDAATGSARLNAQNRDQRPSATRAVRQESARRGRRTINEDSLPRCEGNPHRPRRRATQGGALAQHDTAPGLRSTRGCAQQPRDAQRLEPLAPPLSARSTSAAPTGRTRLPRSNGPRTALTKSFIGGLDESAASGRRTLGARLIVRMQAAKQVRPYALASAGQPAAARRPGTQRRVSHGLGDDRAPARSAAVPAIRRPGHRSRGLGPCRSAPGLAQQASQRSTRARRLLQTRSASTRQVLMSVRMPAPVVDDAAKTSCCALHRAHSADDAGPAIASRSGMEMVSILREDNRHRSVRRAKAPTTRREDSIRVYAD